MKIFSIEYLLVLLLVFGWYIAMTTDKSNLDECKYTYQVLDSDNFSRGYTNDGLGKRCVSTTSGKYCGTFMLKNTYKGSKYCAKKD